MKKRIAIVLALVLALSLCACSGEGQGETANGGETTETYVVGICQLMTHNSLDAATQGFKDALIAQLGEEHVEFKHQDAGGEYTNCGVIVDGFVAEGVDLILANATPPLQAAVAATAEIPVLGTSVTDYATALNIADWTGTVGGNVSGTTDLAPLDQQAQVIQELFPDAETVGMLYCSAEPNSVYQITRVKGCLEEMGYTCEEYAFADVNELSAVCQTACDNSAVISIPTDNTCATYTETIANVVLPAGIPVVASEASTCAAAGVATLAIDYYDLGYATGLMAAKILTGEADVSTMPVESAGEATKMYNPANCELLGVTVPEGYEPVG